MFSGYMATLFYFYLNISPKQWSCCLGLNVSMIYVLWGQDGGIGFHFQTEWWTYFSFALPLSIKYNITFWTVFIVYVIIFWTTWYFADMPRVTLCHVEVTCYKIILYQGNYQFSNLTFDLYFYTKFIVLNTEYIYIYIKPQKLILKGM